MLPETPAVSRVGFPSDLPRRTLSPLRPRPGPKSRKRPLSPSSQPSCRGGPRNDSGLYGKCRTSCPVLSRFRKQKRRRVVPGSVWRPPSSAGASFYHSSISQLQSKRYRSRPALTHSLQKGLLPVTSGTIVENDCSRSSYWTAVSVSCKTEPDAREKHGCGRFLHFLPLR